MFGRLLASRRFLPLFLCQFFSALNDNFLKNALVALIVYVAASENSGLLVQAAGAVFIAPFFFLSGIGGELADRHEKAMLAQRMKLAEIAASGLAAVGFVMHSIPLLMAALGLFGVIAALFGPIKYGILPDHLKTEEIPAGNALVEGATFVAILLGTAAGMKAAAGSGDPVLVAVLIMLIAFACWASALFMPKGPEGAPDLRVDPDIFASTARLVRLLREDARLWRGTLAVSWFWLFGAVVLGLLATMVKTALGGDEDLYILAMAVFAVGIAAGSALAALVAQGRIVLLPTPVAAVLMAAFTIDLGFATLGATPGPVPVGPAEFLATARGLRIVIDLAGLAAAAGLFVVPVFAAVQVWSGEDRRARVIAGGNVIQAGLMVAGSVGAGLLQGAGVSEAHILLGLGAANLVVGALVFRALAVDAARDVRAIFGRV